MPALKNPRHERFARAFVELGVARHAYGAAGFKARPGRTPSEGGSPQDVNAARLLKVAQVKNRVQEIAAMAGKRHEVTIDSLVEELDEARDLARRTEQPAAMTAATMGKARITGNIIERKETGAPGDFSALATPDEIIAKVRTELGEEAAKTVLALLARQPAPADPDPEPVAAPTPTHDPSGGRLN